MLFDLNIESDVQLPVYYAKHGRTKIGSRMSDKVVATCWVQSEEKWSHCC